MQPKEHWEQVYATRSPDKVSWYQEHAVKSLSLIRATGVPKVAAIIDVGGGASRLVDDLIDSGYTNLTVLDLSNAALQAARQRLGDRSAAVQWIEANVLSAELPQEHFDIWHDRAVFHFLTSPQDRQQYVAAVLRALKPGGHVIVATFAADGPVKCSGLPVVRYDARELHAEFGAQFTLVSHEHEEHLTPSGAVQKFIYCHFRLAAS